MENSVAFERATTLERTTFHSMREARERTVIILGGSYAAIQIAHRLLKYVRMSIPNLKVVMVSKNTHLYWNMASVRAIIPGQATDDEVFGNIARGFSQYATDSFVHIIGSAERVDPNSKTVWIDYAPRHSMEEEESVQGGGEGEGAPVERHEVKYEQLILCTGTRTTDPDVPWKNLNSTDETREQLHIMQRKVEKAKHIVVGGAGATGVELAAELAYEYAKSKTDQKEIVLVCKDAHVMGGDSLAPKVEKELAKLGVKLVTNTTVEGREFKESNTLVKLSNGETIETDLYLPATGLIPNSEYLPDRYKNGKGYVTIDEYFRVVGTPNIWAVGDVVSVPRAAFVHTEKLAPGVAMNVENIMRKKDPVKVKGMSVDPLVVALGRKRGAGRAGVVTLPSYGVYWAKGRNLGMNRMAGYLTGSSW